MTSTSEPENRALPDGSEGSSRRGLWIAVGVGIALAAGVVGWWGIRWWTAEPWGKLERVSDTFPQPSGYEIVSQTRVGDRPAVCAIKPSCREPFLVTEYRGSADGDALCELLATSSREWEAAGFSEVDPDNAIPTACVFDGTIAGHTVQFFELPTENGSPGFKLLVGN